ncbi:MAG: hypothetical protein WC004_04990 [Candidatus Absconditabacterales bacterium]
MARPSLLPRSTAGKQSISTLGSPQCTVIASEAKQSNVFLCVTFCTSPKVTKRPIKRSVMFCDPIIVLFTKLAPPHPSDGTQSPTYVFHCYQCFTYGFTPCVG